MSWLWDAFQQRQITDVTSRLDNARFDARLTARAVVDLEEKVDRLSLICHALFEELQRTSGFTEAQLKQRMVEIDLRDGKRDGKLDPGAQRKCPDCAQPILKKRSHCFLCGAALGGLG